MAEIGIGEFARRSRLSLKALRLYDELGVLVPARTDQASGYRYYDTGQVEQARLVGMLRQLQMPLPAIRELLGCDPAAAAARVEAYWRDVETAHDGRRVLASYLVDQLNGKRSVMFEVATREMPERSLLCLKRNVDQQGAWGLGKEFIAIFRERPLPRIAGREGAMFCIFWGQVSADSDGPVEFCRPVAAADAHGLAETYPELTLRTEPAHREAFVALGPDSGENTVQWELASEALRTWASENGIDTEHLAIKPEDLGLRMTYLMTGPAVETRGPDCDFAVPFG